MSTTAAPAEPASRGRPASPPRTLVRRRVALDVSPASDVLVRVLVLLRRRQCRIVGVAFQEADLHGPGRFEVTVLAPPFSVEMIEPWLRGLVDVYAVHVRS